MIYSTNDLVSSLSDFRINNLLESLPLIERNYADPDPVTIPIMELAGLEEEIRCIRYYDLNGFSESNGIDLTTAKILLAEMHNIDADSIVTSIPDYEILANPYLTEEIGPCVLTSISKDSTIYQFCEAMIALYEETGDEDYLATLLEADITKEYMAIMKAQGMMPWEKQRAIESLKRKARADIAKEQQGKNPQNSSQPPAAPANPPANPPAGASGGAGGANNQSNSRLGKILGSIKNTWNNQSDTKKNIIKGAGAAALIGGAFLAGRKHGSDAQQQQYQEMEYLKKLQAEAKNQPRTWLAKKISSLRNIYRGYLERAREAKDAGQAGIFKRIASAILGVIDGLMKRLQNLAN